MKTQERELAKDPFLCTCGPCKAYWKSLFNDGSKQLTYPSCQRAIGTSTLHQSGQMIKVGDRVMVHNRYPGVAKYVGILDELSIAPQVYVGVKLDDNVNSLENGIYNGKRYFHCPRGHGAFVKYNQVQAIKSPTKRPLVFGNQMFPSYDTVRKRRQERSALIEAIKHGSEESTVQLLRSRRHRAKSAPSRMPQLQSTSSNSIQRPATSKSYHTSDKADMRYKDKMREEERYRRSQRHPQEHEETKVITEERQLKKWRQEFGGDERAARMAETLRKLHLAYQEGLELHNNHSDSNESLDRLLS